MEFLILIVIIGVIIYIYNNYKNVENNNNTVDSNNQNTRNISTGLTDCKEFQDALAEAKKIETVFVEATKRHGGSVMIVKYNIDKPEQIDFEREKYHYLIYFRVHLYGYSAYLDWLQSGYFNGTRLTVDDTNTFIDQYLKDMYGKSQTEMEQLGIDPRDIVYDTEKGDNDCESILYYKFVCPCGLQGDKRDIFINELKK